MKIVRLFIFTLMVLPVYGQQNQYLKKLGYYSDKPFTIRDTSKVIDLNKKAKDSVYTNTIAAQDYSRAALDISEKIEFDSGVIEAYINMSRVKINLNDLDSAMYFADLAIDKAKRKGKSLLVVRATDMKGSVYSYKGVYDKAVDHFFEAARLGEAIDEKYALISYANIGHVYNKTGNLPKSAEYCEKSLNLGKKYGDTSVMITAHNLLGLIEKKRHNVDGAIKHFEEGLDLARKSDNRKRQAEILYNMANIYFNKDEFEKGYEYFSESMEISKTDRSYRSIAISYHSLAITQYDQGNVKQSAIYADSALKYALLSQNFEVIMESYAMEAQINADLNKLEDALTYLSYAYVYKDSLNLAQMNSAISDSEGRYESEKKELRAQMLRAQDKKINEEKLWWRDLLLWTSGFILVIVIIGIYMLFRSNKQIKAKNETVEKQKEEILNQHEEIKDSILYAKRIQNALIGNEVEWRKLGANVSIFFRPKDVVSGDFYWVYNNPDKNYSVWAVADCTGHGVPGAFMSMLGIGFLNELIIDDGLTDPGIILDRLRTKIISALENDEDRTSDGMDIGLCVLDRNSGKLKFAGANNGSWILRDKEKISDEYKEVMRYDEANCGLIEIRPDKMPIGHYFKIPPPFITKEFDLISGDTIVLYTDGFADQFGGPEDKKFKYRQLKELLMRIRSNRSLNPEKVLEKTFNDWKGSNLQTDDVCVVTVQWD